MASHSTEPEDANRLAGLRLEAWVGFAIFPLAAVASRRLRAPCDDAYIYHVYARNLLEGQGLTFNGALVEGFTSAGWLALIAFAGALGLPLPVAAELLSTASGLFALLATLHLSRAVGLAGAAALIPVVLVASSGDFAFYLAAGMETPLFAGLVAWCTAEVTGCEPERLARSKGFAAVTASMILVRPEGAAVAGLLLAWLGLRTGSLAPALRAAARVGGIVLPVLLLKALYYGHPLPNTYYAKAHAGLANLGHGIDYLLAALPRIAPLGVLLFVPLSRWPLRPPPAPALALLGLVVAWVVWVALQGGDNLVGARALVPALPWLAVALTLFATSWASGARRSRGVSVAFAAACAAGFASHVLFLLDDDISAQTGHWRRAAPLRRAVAERLVEDFPPDTLVALNPAGIIPYHSRMPTIDMLGLNDVFIAHEGRRDRRLPYGHQAGDGDYVLSRRPGVILFGFAASKRPARSISGKMIWKRDAFHRDYIAIRWPGLGVAYVRRDLAQAISPGGAGG